MLLLGSRNRCDVDYLLGFIMACNSSHCSAADFFQVVELARPAQPGAAVDRDAGAGDVGGKIGKQVRRQVRQFLMLAVAAQRNFLKRRPRRRPAPGGRSRDQAPSVGNEPGAMAFKRMPYFPHSDASERTMIKAPGLGHGRGHDVARAGPGIGRADVQNRRPAFFRRSSVCRRPACSCRFP